MRPRPAKPHSWKCPQCGARHLSWHELATMEAKPTERQAETCAAWLAADRQLADERAAIAKARRSAGSVASLRGDK